MRDLNGIFMKIPYIDRYREMIYYGQSKTKNLCNANFNRPIPVSNSLFAIIKILKKN